MTNSMQETDKSDVILIIGTNTTWNHPVFGGMVKKAVKEKELNLLLLIPEILILQNC
jgi:predicted molibdopterin-dependent oxidoreductase YjgC